MNVSDIKDAIGEEIVARGCFLVDVTVSKDNDIVLTVESESGTIELDDCVSLSKHIEANLDREEEDFELEVGSAGIGQPFKVLQQYINHIGKEVEVLAKDGKKYRGVMARAEEAEFAITMQVKVLSAPYS